MKLRSPALFWGFVSYACWGFFPIYWKLLSDRAAPEIISHRLIWSFVFYVVLFAFFSPVRFRDLFRQNRRDWLLSGAAAILLTTNWSLYVYAVNSNHILEGSLAYFINPILNVAVGVLFFHEGFPMILRIAVGLAAAGVVTRLWLATGFPALALALAVTFCAYGATKKLLRIPALTSSVLEAALGLLPGIAGMIYFLGHAPPPEPRHWFLFVSGGLVTGVPLFLFSYAAQRVPYSLLGLLQFVAPSLQFAVAVLMYDEPFGPRDLVSFGLIWAGILCYGAHQLHRLKAERS